MTRTALLLAILLGTVAVGAQAPVPSPTPPTIRLGFDHDKVNIDGVRLAVDSDPPMTFSIAALAETPTGYTLAFPALTPGTHTLRIAAYNIAGDSALSDPLVVRVVVLPSTPTNVRIVVP